MVKLLLMDREFECIKDEFDKALVSTTAVREHAREIEQSIRTVKEQCRCIMLTMRTAGIKGFTNGLFYTVYFTVSRWSTLFR